MLRIKRMCNVIEGESEVDSQYGNSQKCDISFSNLGGNTQSTPKIKLNKNHIYFYEDITAQTMMELRLTIQSLIDQLLAIDNDFRSQIDKSLMSINLHICTLGGDTYHGIAMYDYLMSVKEKHKFKLNIFVQGYVCSAGTMFLMAGDNRYISRNSFIMIHELSTLFSGKYGELKEQIELCDKIMEKVYLIYSEHSNLSVQELKQTLKKDLWLTSEQSLEKGFVTEIN